jgi:DNA-directed RNA polymerase specialized sigma24 family protein
MKLVFGHNKGQFLSAEQKAEEMGKSEQLIRRHASQGRWATAQKLGKAWAIPAMELPVKPKRKVRK